jgi:hypothetical protein
MEGTAARFARGAVARRMPNHRVEKSFYDYADDIEAVSIHYACTPIGGVVHWETQRSTRYMPLVDGRIRKKVLKLPRQLLDPETGEISHRYSLHHYFEVFQGGDRHYSQVYTEEIVTAIDASAEVAEATRTDQRPLAAAEANLRAKHAKAV